MGKWVNIKPEPAEVRGLCVLCNKNLQKHKGNGKYRPLCSPCDRKRHQSHESLLKDRERAKQNKEAKLRPYRKHVKESCEFCGFVPVHICQLDVDHIDGNHLNNDVENLQTLCANCHRLKTHLNKDNHK